MPVAKGNRKESKVEFDNTYYKIHDDAVKLIENHLGAKGEIKESFKDKETRECLKKTTLSF